MIETSQRPSPFFEDKVTTLKLERKRKKLTISALSRLSCMNAAELSKIERGRVLPYERQARRIAYALRWEGPIEELFSVHDGSVADGPAA